MKICMFVKNSFEFDARVAREARSLVNAGHEVTVVALHVPGVTPEREVNADGVEVIRVRSGDYGISRLAGRAERAARAAVRSQVPADGAFTDQAKMDRVARVYPAMTSTPGADLVQTPSDELVRSEGSTGLLPRIKVRATLALVALLRIGLHVGFGLFRTPARAVKGLVENHRMLRVGRSSRADAFHADDRNTLWVALKSARANGARLVYDSAEFASGRSRMGRLSRRWAAFTERRWLRRVDGLIVASPIWLDMLNERYGRLPLAVAVLNTPPSHEVSPVNLHREAGLGEGMSLLVYQGTIQEHRGLEAAVEALTRLDDVGLVIIGWGHHRPAIEKLVERVGVGDRVRFLGPVPYEDLLDYTAGATVGLCNIVGASLSYRTALPNKLFEYFMAGLPVIGSEGTEIAPIIDETGAGIAVPPEDPDAIAGATRAILADLDKYSAAAVAASRRYHWGVEEAKLLGLYGDLGESGRRGT